MLHNGLNISGSQDQICQAHGIPRIQWKLHDLLAVYGGALFGGVGFEQRSAADHFDGFGCLAQFECDGNG
jgi:hypothetical protein